MERLTVRPASAADVPAILTLIRGIAEYERLSHEVEASEALLRQHGFGPRPVFEALLAERIPEGIQEGSDVAPRPEAVANDGMIIHEKYTQGFPGPGARFIGFCCPIQARWPKIRCSLFRHKDRSKT